MLPQRIVLIEDEAEIAEVVAFALQRAGMDCLHAENAMDGLALLAGAVDLVVLDVGLPDLDGFEVLKRIRRDDVALPVIMLTAQNEEIDRVLGLELGADDYVGKPFSPRELVARIKAVLKRRGVQSQKASAEAPSAQGFDYDEKTCRILWQGQALPLTVTELHLLRHFLAQPGRVFSRAQLLAAAFSDHHPSDERTIDTHIKSLRMKIREGGGGDPIVTHRSLGYSFEPH